LRFVKNVCAEIGAGLASRPDHHVVVVRSTVLPGTTREILIPILEQSSGKRAGIDFGVAVNPEFLREGCGVADYRDPSLVVVGELDERSRSVAERMYHGLEAPFVHTSLEVAELVKYVNNAFHALKVTFANEIGNLCKAHGVDGREVMSILCQDHRLNISPAYLRPGYAFGGSCLPKDLRALLYRAKERDLNCPLLGAVLPSNEAQIQRGIELVERTGLKKVGILGLSFKSGTDDVRESPVIPLVETLVGRGYEVRVFDEQVEPSDLVGANKAFLEREIPHIASLMRASLREVVREVEVLVVASECPALHALPRLIRTDQAVIDLTGLDGSDIGLGSKYEGICW
jgi:GDP-mannose 6-dehydrogenase